MSRKHALREEPWFLPRHFWRPRFLHRLCYLATLVAGCACSSAAHAANPGALIQSRATLDFQSPPGVVQSLDSNIVEVTVSVLRSPASVTLTRVVSTGGQFQEAIGPSACFDGSSFVALANPVLIGGTVIDAVAPQQVATTVSYNQGEPVFIRLEDRDQNVDFQAIDYAEVTVSNAETGDAELLRLAETGLNTGVFAGYIQTAGGTAQSGDCLLQVASNSDISVSYRDPLDPGDATEAIRPVDPTQRVFETRTGTAVSGVTIELVDATTGQPARVMGNDGFSVFPSTLVSGGTVTDAGGTIYAFGPGEFRFPFVPDGDYRILVTPPPAYSAPSAIPEDELQRLPGAPYQLGPASFASEFTKSGELSFAFDIPVDPQATALFMQKRSLATTAAPGDFVRYELAVENSSVAGGASDIRVVDQLPSGARFIPGTVTVNGAAAADPEISPDRATLTWQFPSLDVAETIRIAYVVEIIAGEPFSMLVNRATAFAANGLFSNEATASVQLTEDLFRSTATLIGRVIEGDCSQDTFNDEQGVAGIRIYLEDGRYAVSDDTGRFHFDGLKPGTHVAQLDTFTVPDWFDVVGCSDDPAFAGRADSRFVELGRGALKRADFFLRRKAAPEGRIELELRNWSTGSVDEAGYTLTVNGIGNVPINNIDVMVMLPDGVSYQPASSRLDGAEVDDPRVSGQALSYSLPDEDGSWQAMIEFVVAIAPEVSGELTSKVVATFDTPIEARQRTPVGETRMLREPGKVEQAGYVLDLKFAVLSDQLSPLDQARLDELIVDWRGVSNVQISAVGHSDSQRIAARNRHLFEDNYALSRARAASVATYLGRALDVPGGNIQVAGRGPDEPIADNATAEGRQMNRRVELIISGIRPSIPSFLEVTKASSGQQTATTQGAIPGTEVDDDNGDETALEEQVEPALATLQPGIALLLPTPGFEPAIPSLPVSVQHLPEHTVEVWLNDRPVNPLTFDSIETSPESPVTVSRWRGINLVEGSNELSILVVDGDGEPVQSFKRLIYFGGMPIRAEFVEERSTLVADGKTRPVVAIRLFDRAGRTARPGVVGEFQVEAPFRSWWDVENDRRNQLVQVGDRRPTYRVGADGIALLELEPTTRTGEVTINLPFANRRNQPLRAWLRPATRDWILVGFAEGTAAYASLDKNLEAAEEAGLEDGYFDDGRMAFFAKGRIKGEYLLTVSYDTDRDRAEMRRRFETEIDPTAYYSLYADASEQRFEAASQRKLYLKLERNQFYALFGDYATGLTVTDLARYDRRLNGLQAEYRGEKLSYNVFAAETSQAFHRDELRGDGTSGLYRLSNTPIIGNSESVRIETRDRFDSGIVLTTRKLTRFLDYDLDPLNGTLFFKRPVPSRDLEFNPVYIVVEYETLTNGSQDLVAGGRGAMRFAGDDVELGVTLIDDQTDGSEADLGGVDLRWQVSARTELKAELARTRDTDLTGDTRSADAYSVSVEHNSENLDVRALLREVDSDYGLGYQAAADLGSRRAAVDLRAKLSDRWFVEAETGWQQNLDTDATRRLARGRVRYELDGFTSSLGVSHAVDKFDDGDERMSNLAEVALSRKVLGDRVTLRASGSTSLGGSAESVDFPTSYVFGADYRIRPGVDLVAEYEEASGSDIDASMARLGVRAQPFARTQVNSFVNNEITEFGPRLFANVGLVQGFQLNDRWSIDLGIDQTRTLLSDTARVFDADRELVTGSLNEDFLSLYAGALYNAGPWSANSRVEVRDSDSEDRMSLSFGWYREPTRGLGLSAGLLVYQSRLANGNELTAADLKFGWAYRLADRKWSFLDRVDLVFEDLTRDGYRQDSWRLVNNLVANRRFGAAAELSLQYAFKYVRSNFDSISVTGYSDLAGVDVRRGIRERWQVGVAASVYNSYKSGVTDYGAGLNVGYMVATNVWITLGYNFAGFHDRDFAEARYTADGPFLRFSIKADQQTLRAIAGR